MRRWDPYAGVETARHIPDAEEINKAAALRNTTRALPTNAQRWLKIRKVQLAREPLCRICKRKGKLTPANEVDHIDQDSGNNLADNLQSLCKPCHSRKTRQEGGRASYYPIWMPKPRCRMVVVWGPPAAGKSTYCKEHMVPGDILIDWDDIVREIAGHGRHAWTDREACMATRERNMRLAELENADPGITAWVPTGAPKRYNRQWWEGLGATLVALTPNRETCIARIMEDPERAAQAEKQVSAVDEFFRKMEL